MKKLIVVLTLLCSVAYTEESNLYWNKVPAVCGEPEAVQRYISEKELKPKHISLGRTNGQPDGEPVYMVTFYENEDDETLVTVNVPNDTETCILYHTFNKVEVIN